MGIGEPSKWERSKDEPLAVLTGGVYRAIFEQSRDAIIVAADDGTYLEANNAACALFGVGPGELNGRHVGQFAAEHPPDGLWTEFTSSDGMSGEFAIKRADGEVRLVEYNAVANVAPGHHVSIMHDVTERRRIESQLRESEARFRDLFENAGDIMYTLGLDGRFIEMNDAAVNLLGYTREEIATMDAHDVVAPGQTAPSFAAREEKLEDPGRVHTYEIELRTKSGELRTVEITSRGMVRDGQLVAVQAVGRDMTERKRAEEALAASEARFRDLFENASDIMYTLDAQGRMVEFNDAYPRMLGYTRDEFVKLRVTDILTLEGIERSRRARESRAVDPGLVTVFENEVITKSGERRTIEVTSRAVVENGVVTGSQAIGRDVTVRQRAEEALAASEARYRRLVESASDLIFVIDEDGFLASANRACTRLLGYTTAELVGRPYREILTPEGVAQAIEIRRQRMAGDGSPLTYESTLRAKDGTLYQVELSSHGFQEEGRQFVHVAARDITARRAAEQEIRDSEERFRAIVETFPGAVLLEQGGQIVLHNRGALALTGLTSIDSDSQRFLASVLPGDFRERTTVLDDMGENAGGILSRRVPIRRPNGEERIVEVHVSQLHHQGKPARLVVAFDVTEQQRAEDAIRDSEERLRAVLEQLPCGVWMHDGESPLLLNPRFAAMTGYTVEQLMEPGFIFDRLFTPENGETMRQRSRDRMRGLPVPDNYTMPIVRSDGEQRWIEVSAIRTQFRGTPAALLAVFDVTEREAAEQALRDSEEQLTAILESMPVGIWMHNGRQPMLLNRRFVEMTGYTHEELMRPEFVVDHLYLPEDRQMLRERRAARVRNESVPQSYTVQMIRADGERRWIEVHGINIRYHGDVAALLAVFDVTEREDRQRLLQDTEERLRMVLDALPCGAWVFDGEAIAFANHSLAELTGQPLERLMEMNFFGEEVVHPEDREWMLERGMARLAGLDVPPSYEVRIVRTDGETRIFAIDAAPIQYGERNATLATAFDVTESRKLEEERREFELRMQQTQKLESLGVLAGGIAHDFNNLLVGILGNADLALSDLPPEAPARSTVSDIQLAAQRAADLTRQMLAYSGKGRFVIEPLNLSLLVEEMAHLLEVSINKSVTLRYNFAATPPPVEADATQLRQVVMNLITNASDAIGARPGVVSVTTGSMHADSDYLKSTYLDDELPEGEYTYVEVSDNGSGMDSATAVRIFDPFFTTKFTGRGLGLAAVLGIVRGHRGAIKVYSEPGRGTTFKVLFPSLGSTAAASSNGGNRPKEEWTATGKLLLVDDDETVRTVAERMLLRAGFTVLSAEHGADAIELFGSHGPFDLVVLDLTMPGMNGVEVFQELRQMDSSVRVILMSGYNEQDATNQFVGKGLAGFIQKPFVRGDLLATIQQVMEEGEEGGA